MQHFIDCDSTPARAQLRLDELEEMRSLHGRKQNANWYARGFLQNTQEVDCLSIFIQSFDNVIKR
ncbi:uncharacterized protein EAF02_004395 [Botrytis sinoallii]|uniref:uncharacterized protein n=1 Tax=Botrytis sinoallii TaxID=1463999 RepID=UPI00190027E0|nr:uncharacterized protein EAF02_004395 [Botrytis sinoallii]KAF7885886.1 hypothetical protein EAF02_004395 [Botrytis sinoallii]